MTKTLQPNDVIAMVEQLSERVTKLERRSPGEPGTMTWTDPATGNEIIIGYLADGTFGIQVGNARIIAATSDFKGHGLDTSGQALAFSVSGSAFFITSVD